MSGGSIVFHHKIEGATGKVYLETTLYGTPAWRNQTLLLLVRLRRIPREKKGRCSYSGCGNYESDRADPGRQSPRRTAEVSLKVLHELAQQLHAVELGKQNVEASELRATGDRSCFYGAW